MIQNYGGLIFVLKLWNLLPLLRRGVGFIVLMLWNSFHCQKGVVNF